MVEIGKLKIKKQSYKFEVKKRYQNVTHYKVKDRPPIERIKDQIRSLLAPKKKKALAEVSSQAISGKPPGGFNFAIVGAFIFIALIILAIGWLYLSAVILQPGIQTQLEKPDIENTILSGDIMSAG